MTDIVLILLACLVFGIAAVLIALVGAARVRRHYRNRDGIQRLESYANHPGARRLLDDIHNQPREEEL